MIDFSDVPDQPAAGEKCPDCTGSGKRWVYPGGVAYVLDCSTCKGTGRVPIDEEDEC